MLPEIADESLHPEPLFFVETPDGRRDWTELNRVVAFRQFMRMAAPKVLIFANANAGKRNPMQARREGIVAGVFDYTAHAIGRTAYLEFKGYSKAGRPGVLSDNQVEFGNRMHRFGIPCACFFSPHRAVDWLREQGFPVAEVRDAA